MKHRVIATDGREFPVFAEGVNYYEAHAIAVALVEAGENSILVTIDAGRSVVRCDGYFSELA